jgi:hypothetical protein
MYMDNYGDALDNRLKDLKSVYDIYPILKKRKE